MHNAITDIPGLMVGHAHDERVMSGVSVLVSARPMVAAVDVRGGGTGSRETEALSLAGTVDEVHAILLAGGSAFGLAAASAVHAELAARGVGYAVGSARVPIVPAAVLFDLTNGGDKSWGAEPPYEWLGRAALRAASVEGGAAAGSVGAGFGATTGNLRGGLGTASTVLAGGVMIGALAAVNPIGSVTAGETRHFWAAPFERGTEFGGYGFPAVMSKEALELRLKGALTEVINPQATTIAIVATNARLSKRGAHRLAVMAQTGVARAIYPVHTPLDGDLVFSVSTGDVAFEESPWAMAVLGAEAANTLARAIARGVYCAAVAPPGWGGPLAYRSRFGL